VYSKSQKEHEKQKCGCYQSAQAYRGEQRGMEERAKRPKQEAQRAQRCGVLEKGSQPLLTSYGVWAKLILFLFQW